MRNRDGSTDFKDYPGNAEPRDFIRIHRNDLESLGTALHELSLGRGGSAAEEHGVEIAQALEENDKNA